jgi:hypothetical protein
LSIELCFFFDIHRSVHEEQIYNALCPPELICCFLLTQLQVDEKGLENYVKHFPSVILLQLLKSLVDALRKLGHTNVDSYSVSKHAIKQVKKN